MKEKSAQAQRPVMLNDGTRLVRIELCDVAYIEAERYNCIIHLRDGKTSIPIAQSMSKVHEQLPQDVFVRIHRSYVVNIHLVHIIYGRGTMLSSGDMVAIGETYINDFVDRFTVINKATHGRI